MKHDIIVKLHEAFKIEGHTYEVLKNTKGQRVFVGEDGILGHNDVFISWGELDEFMSKCRGTESCADNLNADAPRQPKFKMNK